ncbi:hypothetical protein ACFX5U_07795 [Sphingobacterium sp. SG20118]|uniref:hypothetical protein n=1 Tax=Sphingobacterium sp. SG20118 TaxID=3367156 RepID=UPI0037DFC440
MKRRAEKPPDEAGKIQGREDGLPVSDVEDVLNSNVFINEMNNDTYLNKKFTKGKEKIDENE